MSRPMPSEEEVNEAIMKIADVTRNMLLGLNIFHGDQLGIYKAMQNVGRIDVGQLAQLTKLDERYLEDWLMNQASNGILMYHAESGTFSLSPTFGVVLADPAIGVGCLQTAVGIIQNTERIQETYRKGTGIRWGDQGLHVREGCARFFGPEYEKYLVEYWLPLVGSDVIKQLERGNSLVADIGCGYGVSTRLLAKAFPKCSFVGLDYDVESIKQAKEQTKHLPNCSFECMKAKEYCSKTGNKFDMVAFFDSFHDMAEPPEVVKEVRECLKPNGKVFLVEPKVMDNIEDNMKFFGFQLFSGFSCTCCLEVAKADHKKGPALGPIAPTTALKKVWNEGGFHSFQVFDAPKTPLHRIILVSSNTPASQ